MRIGLLTAGAPPRALTPVYGDYPAMFEALLAGRGYDWATYDLPAGAFPDAPEDCGAYIVTGAADGVYDDKPWIAALLEFLRAAKGRAQLVGVCFGHQAMAQAFGGEVIKSPKGWGIGLHAYAVEAHRPWMDDARRIALPASHQDQVVVQPPATTVLAGSDFCPFGMLAWQDQPAISIQLHPEFVPDYAAALISGRRRERFAEEDAERAIASLAGPNDNARVADWIAGFLAG
ncbi:MAG: type 1 glutamine amidotransferase [Caulobacterales bacterium]